MPDRTGELVEEARRNIQKSVLIYPFRTIKVELSDAERLVVLEREIRSLVNRVEFLERKLEEINGE